MNVDLPAPLSPSTQVTCPARTVVEMSDSEITLPKVLVTLRISSSGASVSRTSCTSMSVAESVAESVRVSLWA